MENLHLLAPAAEKAGITLLLEALNSLVDHKGYFLDTATAGFEIVREVGHPSVRLLYDIYHMQIMQGNVIETVQRNIGLIGHFHAAGVPGRHEVFGGELDYRHILDAIAAAGDRGASAWSTGRRTTTQQSCAAPRSTCREARGVPAMKALDIAPFGLPNVPRGEVWFEDPRDIAALEVDLRGWPAGCPASSTGDRSGRTSRSPRRTPTCAIPPDSAGSIPTTGGTGPGSGHPPRRNATAGPCACASSACGRKGSGTSAPSATWTSAAPSPCASSPLPAAEVGGIRVFTTSSPVRSTLRIRLDAGRATPTARVGLDGYNCRIAAVHAPPGAEADGGTITFRGKRRGTRCFSVDIRHLRGTHRYANDTGPSTLRLDRDEFTVSVDDALAGSASGTPRRACTSRRTGVPDFAAYRALDRDAATISQRVRRHPEQSFAGAFQGLPRPHAVETHVACRPCASGS